MQVDKSKLVKVFLALGVSPASGWDARTLSSVVNSPGGISQYREWNFKFADSEVEKLFEGIRTAQSTGDKIRVWDDEAYPKKPKARKPTMDANPVGRPRGGQKFVITEKHFRPDGRPIPNAPSYVLDYYRKHHPLPLPKKGVTFQVIQELKHAGKTGKSLTKEEIVDILCVHFPDRQRSSMTSTVNILIPRRLKAWYNVNVFKSKVCKDRKRRYQILPPKQKD